MHNLGLIGPRMIGAIENSMEHQLEHHMELNIA